MVNYVPCRDNFHGVKKILSVSRGKSFDRYCPSESNLWFCLVPSPINYKLPLPWPESLSEVWIGNFPPSTLVRDGIKRNFFTQNKEKLRVQDDTQAHELSKYLSKIHPNVTPGVHIKIILDVGSGLGRIGAAFHNVSSLHIAPKDFHRDGVQLSLERGIPSMLASFAMHRLPFPSEAFDMVYCSACDVEWTRDGGILLLEANRIIRGAGYFLLKIEVKKEEEHNFWSDVENLSKQLCWTLINKMENVALWKKPSDNKCYLTRGTGAQPPLCDAMENQDDVWYVPLKSCIPKLRERVRSISVRNRYKSLDVPERLQNVELDAYVPRVEAFLAEKFYWKMAVQSYIDELGWRKLQFRNVMDMRANFGGFAAALAASDMKCWIINVIPVSGPNTLPLIYDQGLIGAVHDWCEPFDTYPRTYDLLHASGIFSTEDKRCGIITILLEMDRILRPGGHAYIRDSVSLLVRVEALTKLIGWRTEIIDINEGVYGKSKILHCQKLLLHF
ncbi:probable methyltransferase PMT11 isoform X3 [Amborella trichopoda]|nr:probable methyltransferase PMT11 isoform X3 [Amborella trichopoda]|eukprot:XP_020524861.1 probable methyltransferase PMT11 isoform X3 [Amborella trichopoda]